MNIDDLPNEILYHTMKELPLESLHQASKVSQRFYHIANEVHSKSEYGDIPFRVTRIIFKIARAYENEYNRGYFGALMRTFNGGFVIQGTRKVNCYHLPERPTIIYFHFDGLVERVWGIFRAINGRYTCELTRDAEKIHRLYYKGLG